MRQKIRSFTFDRINLLEPDFFGFAVNVVYQTKITSSVVGAIGRGRCYKFSILGEMCK